MKRIIVTMLILIPMILLIVTAIRNNNLRRDRDFYYIQQQLDKQRIDSAYSVIREYENSNFKLKRKLDSINILNDDLEEKRKQEKIKYLKVINEVKELSIDSLQQYVKIISEDSTKTIDLITKLKERDFLKKDNKLLVEQLKNCNIKEGIYKQALILKDSIISNYNEIIVIQNNRLLISKNRIKKLERREAFNKVLKTVLIGAIIVESIILVSN